MISIADSIRNRGGLAATYELHQDGHPRSAVAQAVRAEGVIRVRQGWYSLLEVTPLLREAARVGGAATCMTGLRMHGVWTTASAELHVAVAPHACRLRTRKDKRTRLMDATDSQVRIHWTDSESAQRLLLDPIDCLADLIRCESIEIVTAVADSTLRLFPEVRAAWAQLIKHPPFASLTWLSRVDGICESGTESIFNLRMTPLGIPMRRQVAIPGIGRVDFLIGRRLIVEVDSVTYHTDPDRFEADRRRDARLSAQGYRVLRFSFKQVFERWHEVHAAVVGAVLRGDHL